MSFGTGLRRRGHLTGAFFAVTLGWLLLWPTGVSAQATFTWNASGGTAWLTTGNWTGGVTGKYPGVSSVVVAGSNNINDIALFAGVGTPVNGLGINMNTTGGFSVGAISVTGATNLIVGNSTTSAAGILQLNGAYSGNTNGLSTTTLLNATGGDLTLRNNAQGGTQAMGVRLGITGGVVNAGTGRTVTISSNITEVTAGSGLSVTGGGLLILGGTNSFTGAITPSNSAVQYNTAASFGTAANVTSINGGSALGFGYSTFTQADVQARVTGSASGTIGIGNGITYSGGLDFSTAGLNYANATLGSTGTGTFTGSFTPFNSIYRLGGGTGTLTFAPNIAGANALVVGGSGTAGTVILSGTGNSYTGTTTVNSTNVLSFATSTALPTASLVTVLTGGGVSAEYAIDAAFFARIDPASTGAVAVSSANAATALNFAGFPTLALAARGAVAYTGTLTPNGTTYRLGGLGNLSVGTGVLAGTGNALVVVGGTGTSVTLTTANAYGGGTTFDSGPIVTGSGTAGNAALIVNAVGALGTGAVTIPAINNLRPLEFGLTGAAAISNPIVLPSSLTGRVGIQGRDSTSNYTLSGQITGGSANLNLFIDFGNTGSSGSVRLTNAANDFVATVLSNRGNLAVNSDGALGNAANVIQFQPLTTSTGFRLDADNLTINHTLNTQGSYAINVNGDNNGDGVVDSNNNVTLASLSGSSTSSTITFRGGATTGGTSAGTIRLTGANTSLSNLLSVLADTKLIAANATALGTTTTTSALTIASGGTLAFTGGLTFSGGANRATTVNGAGTQVGGVGVGAIQNISGNNTFNANITLASNSAFGSDAGRLALGGTITGAGFTITKVGAGTVSLAGTINGSGAVLVSAGTLSGSGTYTPTANSGLTVASGAALVPGAASGSGTLTFGTAGVNNPMAFVSGSTFAPIINSATGFSQLSVLGTGAIALNSANFTLTFGSGYTGAGTSTTTGIPVLLNGTGAALGGTFTVANNGTGLTTDGLYSYQLSYFGSNTSITGGNDVVVYNVQPVPEPTTVFAVCGAAVLVVRRFRRRV